MFISDLSKDKKEREFLYAFYLYGSAHHYQDSAVFSNQVKYLVNPFMDIDFLELLSHSSFLSVNKPGMGFKDKLFSSKLQIAITDLLAPQLSDITYAKKGQYTAKEFLGNPIIYLINSFIRNVIRKQYPYNFPYGNWFRTFCHRGV